MEVKEFFSEILEFDFNSNELNQFSMSFFEDRLTNKLKNSVYYYNSSKQTNTSFYLVTISLNDLDVEEIRKYVWNKSNAELIFYPNEKGELLMLYAKQSPKVPFQKSILDCFSTTEKDTEKIQNIQQWQFDSGAFWFNYSTFVKKAKYKSIDKELVSTLEALKEKLNEVLKGIENAKIIVQALIDRTLYIKYLEDNHIINSDFYNYYFNDKTLNYSKLLENGSNEDLNKLFTKIHEIFNNSLFENPSIDDRHLTNEVKQSILLSFNSELKTGQLRLYDFRFDVLPVEFISYIYEVFLSKEQKDNGIYYTPKKLAQLIVDDVICEDKIGPILDPSSGSGMFLIIGFQRLLEIAQKQGLEPQDSLEKIKFRTKLLAENIFGIEKQVTAQRFTLFSLSLQIFKDIEPNDIRYFIANQLALNQKIDLFSEYSFFENIRHANTLDISEKRPFQGKAFSYILGNPPFFEVPNKEDFKDENVFLKSFQIDNIFAKNIVGKSQISQCFFLKIKDWADDTTRFGFVSNSSNFYNDKSDKFQKFFYSNYGIEKIYELSRVKEILFEKAKESVVALIFNNQHNSNIIDYYPVEMGLFSYKPFELLIIQEDKVIQLNQKDLIGNKIRLRDFLVGNEYDLSFVSKLNGLSNKFSDQIKILNGSKSKINNGLQIVGKEQVVSEFCFSEKEYNKLTKHEKQEYSIRFKKRYTRVNSSEKFPIPLIEAKDLLKFNHQSPRIYLGEITNFQRTRNPNIYSCPKILLNRTGGQLNASVSLNMLYYNFDVYSIFLNDDTSLFFYTALLNSYLLNYFIDFNFRKRANSSYTKIGHNAILNLPLPKCLDEDLVNEISELSQKLTKGELAYSDKEQELNELIYDLYDLSYWERKRVEDYFLPKKSIGQEKNALKKYKETLKKFLGFYIKSPIVIEKTSTDFNVIVLKISLGNTSNTAKVNKTKKFILNEMFQENPNQNFLTSQEKIYGKDCVYIIKDNMNKHWTETKAFEDGKDILKHLTRS